MLQPILDALTSDAALTAIGGLLATLLALLIKAERTRKTVLAAASLAYDVVNALKAKTATKIDDKAALALAALRDQLGRDLSPAEAEAAKTLFTERHDRERAALKLAVDALAKFPKLEVK
jgi:hypothetical protein